MTKDEWELKVPLTNPRRIRIVKGAGVSAFELSLLEENIKQIKKMVDKFNKLNLTKDTVV